MEQQEKWDIMKKLSSMHNSIEFRRPMGGMDRVPTLLERDAYIVEHIAKYDGEMWAIFINIMGLTPDNIRESISVWRVAYPLMYSEAAKYSWKLREQMRFAMAITLLEEEFGFNKDNPASYAASVENEK